MVPPVGFEPTLRTLLGGRPLPLGYGGALIVTHFSYLAGTVEEDCRRPIISAFSHWPILHRPYGE